MHQRRGSVALPSASGASRRRPTSAIEEGGRDAPRRSWLLEPLDMTAVIWLVVGGAVGAGLVWAVLSLPYFGRLVEPYEQAVLRAAGGLEVRNGPTRLRLLDLYELVAIYDVSDKLLEVRVEPVYAPLPPGSELERRRLFVEVVVHYRPLDMAAVLSLGNDVETWMTNAVTVAVRTHALTTVYTPSEDGSSYARAVSSALGPALSYRGMLLLDVVVRRIGFRTDLEMQSLIYGTMARNLGREGLVLRYLQALEKVGESPSNTMVVPTELLGKLRLHLDPPYEED